MDIGFATIVSASGDKLRFSCPACGAEDAATIIVGRDHLGHLDPLQCVLLRGQLELILRNAPPEPVRRAARDLRRWLAVQGLSPAARTVLAGMRGVEEWQLPTGAALGECFADAAKRRPNTPAMGSTMFAPSSRVSLGITLTGTTTYRELKRTAGRRAPKDDVVVAVIDAAYEMNGRLRWDAFVEVTGANEVQAKAYASLFPSVLNVEGYSVFRADQVSGHVVVDLELLCEQFDLPLN